MPFLVEVRLSMRVILVVVVVTVTVVVVVVFAVVVGSIPVFWPNRKQKCRIRFPSFITSPTFSQLFWHFRELSHYATLA